MLLRLPLAFFALSMASSVWANTLDFDVTGRRAKVNDVRWNGFEYGFAYLFDINEALALGPYLSSTRWDISNSALHTDSSGDHREFGPRIRFLAPMETLDFLAGASYSLFSKGTAKAENGMTADLEVRGLRFQIGLGIPFDSGFDLNVFFITGVQTVELKNQFGKASEDLNDLALAIGLSF